LHTRRCQELFAELDRSGAGVLDRRELTSMVLRMLPEVRRWLAHAPDLAAAFARLDVNGGGSRRWWRHSAPAPIRACATMR
jgi:hypothetical protein